MRRIRTKQTMGKDGFVTNLTDGPKYCKAIVNADDTAKVNAVYKWLSGKKAYAYRLNKRPESYTEHVVMLGVSNYAWFLNADVGIDVSWPALGVRPAKNTP